MDKQVLFYNLQDDNQIDKSICQITNFYYKKRLKILIICEDKPQIDTLNDLLWTFEQISFIPHSVESDYENSPVVLCIIDNLQSALNKYKFDVLFNLTRKKINLDTVATLFIEIVTSIEKQKLNAREKFNYYKKNEMKVSYEKF